MICPKCKREILDIYKYCPKCGAACKTKNSSFKKIIISFLTLVICAGIFSISYFATNYYKSQINQIPSKVSDSNINKLNEQNSVSSNQNNADEISPEEAAEKVKKISLTDVILTGTAVAKENDVRGAEELVGKKCYFFGYEDGNGCFYVVNAENGDVYETIEQSNAGQTVIPAQQRTIAANASVDLTQAILGHWKNNQGVEEWYGKDTCYCSNSNESIDKFNCIIISDKQAKDAILDVYKSKYIDTILPSNTIQRAKYNFTDDMINNSVIVKSYDNSGDTSTELIVFNSDKKSYKAYILIHYQDYFISYNGNESNFVDSKQCP